MADVAGAIIPVITGILGYLLRVVMDWWSASQKQEKKHQKAWLRNRQQYYEPLLHSARELEDRLTFLKKLYNKEMNGDPDSLSEDFRELFMLSRDPIIDLETAKPHEKRKKYRNAVHDLRVRMAHDLNFATSTLYHTARYLALARSMRLHLEGWSHGMSKEAVNELKKRIQNVRTQIQGRVFGIDRCVPVEVQDSIGEVMSIDNNRFMTQTEFRQRLLEVPGWEQFIALMKFFITDGQANGASLLNKIHKEMRGIVRTLNDLCLFLEYLTGLERPSDYQIKNVPGPTNDPWPELPTE